MRNKIQDKATYRRWYLRNREKKKAQRRAWGAKNHEKCLATSRASYYRHREKRLVERKIHYQLHKAEVRDKDLRKRYGIGIKEYKEILFEQNGVCAICKIGSGKRNLAVDHRHSDGVIRGLLCVRCNRLLGCALDNLAILRCAIRYLTKKRP